MILYASPPTSLASTIAIDRCCFANGVQAADLVIVELTVNDPPASFTSTTRHSYEQLLRTLLQLESRPAVILLHHYKWWESFGDGLPRGLFYPPAEAQLTTYSHVRCHCGGSLMCLPCLDSRG